MKQILNWFIRLDNSNKVALIIALLGMGGGVFTYFNSSGKKDTAFKETQSPSITQTIHGDDGTQIGNNTGTIHFGNPSHSESRK